MDPKKQTPVTITIQPNGGQPAPDYAQPLLQQLERERNAPMLTPQEEAMQKTLDKQQRMADFLATSARHYAQAPHQLYAMNPTQMHSTVLMRSQIPNENQRRATEMSGLATRAMSDVAEGRAAAAQMALARDPLTVASRFAATGLMPVQQAIDAARRLGDEFGPDKVGGIQQQLGATPEERQVAQQKQAVSMLDHPTIQKYAPAIVEGETKRPQAWQDTVASILARLRAGEQIDPASMQVIKEYLASVAGTVESPLAGVGLMQRAFNKPLHYDALDAVRKAILGGSDPSGWQGIYEQTVAPRRMAPALESPINDPTLKEDLLRQLLEQQAAQPPR